MPSSEELGSWSPLLVELRGRLLVQCAPADADRVATVADRAGAGMIVTLGPRSGFPRAAAEAVARVERLRDGGYRQPVLLDAGRYSGDRRKLAGDPFDTSWIALQRRRRVAPVLTDSGYLADGDTDGLSSILRRAALLGDVVAVLPLHRSWLSRQPQRQLLLDRVEATGVPVAVVIEHSADPLGVHGVLAGLLELLGGAVPVILLRADTSALGALCYGAASAAVGTTSRLRHLYPAGPGRPSRPGGPAAPAVSAVVPQCLAYVDVNRIAAAVQDNPDEPMWRCDCAECKVERLDWLAGLGSREQQEQAAFTHSLHVLLDLHDHLHRAPDPGRRRASWLAHVANAVYRWEEIRAESQPSWSTPKFLQSWQAVAGGAGPVLGPE